MDRLTAEDEGVYLVTTQGSVHEWHPSEGFYIRRPQGESSRSMAEFRNEEAIYWIEVKQWPEVGSVFLTVLPGDLSWHRSSTIKSIEKVDQFQSTEQQPEEQV